MDQKENTTSLNLFQKIRMITTELGVIQKNLSVSTGKSSYKAVSERDVIDAVKPLEERYGVYSYPYEREIIENSVLTKTSEYNGTTKETNSFFMRLKTTYRFVNTDNPDQYIDTIVFGDGIDTGDKAPWKAMTYADKYALMKMYKISTGDDPDKEASPQEWYKKEEKSDWKKEITADFLSKLRNMDSSKIDDLNVFQFIDKISETHLVNSENKKDLISVFTSLKQGKNEQNSLK